MKIILASGSPRRKEILEKIGLQFVVEESGFEEITLLKNPTEIVKLFSKEKAKAVIKKYPEDLIIAADTVVVLGNKVMGKPKSELEAGQMLKKLSGKSHIVITGLSVAFGKKLITKVSKTKVKFNKISKKEIDAYVKTKEPLDKSGAYGIQGKAGIFVKEIKGDYFNILGMPVGLLASLLSKFNFYIPNHWDKL